MFFLYVTVLYMNKSNSRKNFAFLILFYLNKILKLDSKVKGTKGHLILPYMYSIPYAEY